MAPERTAAIEHLADSYGKVAEGLSDVGEYLDHIATWVRWGFVVIVVTGLVFGCAIGYSAWNGYQGARARKTLLTQSARIQRVSDEVHSAVTPGEPIYQQGQSQQAAVIGSLVDEIECRVRAALAGKPDIAPGARCT